MKRLLPLTCDTPTQNLYRSVSNLLTDNRKDGELIRRHLDKRLIHLELNAEQAGQWILSLQSRPCHCITLYAVKE